VRETKFRGSLEGTAKLCALGRRLSPGGFFSLEQCLRTWSGLEEIDRNRPASAWRASSSNVVMYLMKT